MGDGWHQAFLSYNLISELKIVLRWPEVTQLMFGGMGKGGNTLPHGAVFFGCLISSSRMTFMQFNTAATTVWGWNAMIKITQTVGSGHKMMSLLWVRFFLALPVFLLTVEHTQIDTHRTFLLTKQPAVSSLCCLPLGFTVKANSGCAIFGVAVETHSHTLCQRRWSDICSLAV